MKAISVKIIHGEGREKYIFLVLSSFFVFFLALYFYFLNTAIWQTAQREKMESKISSLIPEVSLLDGQVFSLQSGITLEHAYALGFKDVSGDVKFITRKSLGRALSLNNEI